MYVSDRLGLRLVLVDGALPGRLNRRDQGSSGGGRDAALDILRGWFIVMMVMAHVGGLTRASAVAHLPLYLSAGYGFVLLSGVVLGLAGRKRLDAGEGRAAYTRMWKRAGSLWALHCALTLAVLLVHEYTGRLPDERYVADLGGWPHVALMIPTLRLQPLDYMNILPLYVLFLLAAPLVLAAARRGWSVAVGTASVVLYSVAQFQPEILRVSSPRSGALQFAPAAWQLLFVVGLLFGYHALEWRARSPQWRRQILAASAVVFGALFIYAQTQRQIFAPLHFTHWLPAILFDRERCGPLALIYMLTGAGVAYALLQRAIAYPQVKSAFEWLALMGRMSLFCFLLHLGIALASRFFTTWSWPMPIQEALTLSSVAMVYAAARLWSQDSMPTTPPRLRIVSGGGGMVFSADRGTHRKSA